MAKLAELGGHFDLPELGSTVGPDAQIDLDEVGVHVASKDGEVVLLGAATFERLGTCEKTRSAILRRTWALDHNLSSSKLGDVQMSQQVNGL